MSRKSRFFILYLYCSNSLILILNLYKYDRKEMENIATTFSGKFGERVLKKNDIDQLCDENTKSTFYAFTPQKIKLVSKKLNIHMDEYEDISL